jgi:hypothetical protein
MLCAECGAELDEINDPQPVCPGCGISPGVGADNAEIGAIVDEAVVCVAAPADAPEPELGPEIDELTGPTPMPRDLQEALDDAEALLLATGHATFDLPEGFRMFQLPTERIM